MLGLEYAKLGVLRDGSFDWSRVRPELAGLDYGTLGRLPQEPRDLEPRFEWLARNVTRASGKATEQFNPQPYRQLERVLAGAGHDELARRVAIRRERERRRRATPGRAGRFKGSLLGLVLGYGYRPFRALFGLLAILVASAAVYSLVAAFVPKQTAAGTLATRRPTATRTANAWPHPRRLSVVDSGGYSLEALPGFDFGEHDAWTVARHRNVLLPLFWFETIAAWVLVPLFAAAATGLIRRRD